MKYCLVVYLRNECFEITGYSKIPGFEHINENKLKDIVEFTNEFESEQELICYLIDAGLLPEKYFKGTIGINYYKGKNTTPKTLQYGVSFNEDKRFFDTIFLQYYFSSRMKNKAFMEAFIAKYYTYLKDVPVFSESINYVRYSYNEYTNHGYLPEASEYYMETFIKFYCRKRSKDGYYKADFTKIRDLAMFAIDYERTYIREVPERPKHTIKELEAQIEHYQFMIEHDNLDEEQFEAYTAAITRLENELSLTQSLTLNRRKKNETAKN